MSQELTQDYLKSILHYDPDTGVFTWLKKLSNNTKVMGVAGTIAQDGYVKIRINSQGYPAHRLAWFYFYGTFPQEQLDHINLNRSDNAIKNLRIALSFFDSSTQSRPSIKSTSFFVTNSIAATKYFL